MPKLTALLASAALVLPTTAAVAPAAYSVDCPSGFSPSPTGDGCLASATNGDRIENCAKTKYGVKVRVKMRRHGDFIRVRVSHPRGTGNFYAPRVRKVSGQAVFADGGAITRILLRNAPSQRFRQQHGSVAVTFKLRNHRHISLGCGIAE